MWMCEACIVVDRRNADGNSLQDLVAALQALGATVELIDEERHIVQALVPAHEMPTLHLMEGVSYVRSVCHYNTSSERLSELEEDESADFFAGASNN